MAEEKKGFFKRLVSGLTKTRDNIVAGFDSIFSGYSSIDEDFYEELEEILIMGDIGINATSAIIEKLKEQVSEQHIKNPAECKQLLIDGIKEQMRVDSTEYAFENQKSVILVIGVNGVGKTTSVGKLAGKLKDQGKKVILAAADTFRAAAGEQLAQWANRAGVDLIGGQAGADPASIVYDAVAAAKARNADVLICDTAGRLHNKKNLMEELRKIYRILEEELKRDHSGIPHGGFVIRSGKTGWNDENSHVIEYSLKLDSNPEFTSSVIAAYARAAYRMSQEGQKGCKTVFDVAPAYLSAQDGAELRKHLL